MESIGSNIFFILRFVLTAIAIFVLARCFVMLMKKKLPSQVFGTLFNSANGDEIEIVNYETSIGRSKMCDIRLGYATVSRFHAVLAYRNDGFFVFDTNSKMGVFVNGVKIDKPTEVFNGDNIAFGNIPMKLVCEDNAEVEPLSESDNRYIESIVKDVDLKNQNVKTDTGEIPNIFAGAYLFNEMNGEKLRLRGNSCIIGRDAEQSDIQLDFPFVSRQHARLVLTSGNKWAVEDLNSTVGTSLNGQKISSMQLLYDGDVISIGGISFEYREGAGE